MSEFILGTQLTVVFYSIKSVASSDFINAMGIIGILNCFYMLLFDWIIKADALIFNCNKQHHNTSAIGQISISVSQPMSFVVVVIIVLFILKKSSFFKSISDVNVTVDGICYIRC